MVEYIPCLSAPAVDWGFLPATGLASRIILIEQNIKKRTGPALWLLCEYAPTSRLTNQEPKWSGLTRVVIQNYSILSKKTDNSFLRSRHWVRYISVVLPSYCSCTFDGTFPSGFCPTFHELLMVLFCYFPWYFFVLLSLCFSAFYLCFAFDVLATKTGQSYFGKH